MNILLLNIRFKHELVREQGKNLSPEERRELQYYEDKVKLDFVYNKKIRGEQLSSREENAFKELTSKYKKKLKITEDVLLEEIPTNSNEIKFTAEDEKRLNELELKEKNNSFDSIFEEGELIDLREKKKIIL